MFHFWKTLAWRKTWYLQGGAPKIVKLVNTTLISLGLNGIINYYQHYQPTYTWGTTLWERDKSLGYATYIDLLWFGNWDSIGYTWYNLGNGKTLGIYIYIKIRYYIWYISWDIFWAGGIKAGIVAHLLYFLRTKWGTCLVDNLIHYPSNLNEKTKRLLAVAGISFICCQSIHGSFNGLIDLVDIGWCLLIHNGWYEARHAYHSWKAAGQVDTATQEFQEP